MADDLDELRSRIRIVDLVGQLVKLKKAGRHWTGLCPFHDDRNPSFSVSDETGRYRCWSCGEKGDLFNWVMKTQNVDFAEAVRILAASIGYTLKRSKPEEAGLRDRYRQAMTLALEFFRDQLGRSNEAQAYLSRRQFEPSVVETWELGYAPPVDGAMATFLSRNGVRLAEARDLFLVEQDGSGGFYDKFKGRLMFPIRDERGQLVAFGGRLLGDGVPKYINSSDTPLFRKSKTLYGLDRAKGDLSGDRPLVLCEGYIDVIAAHQAGVTTACASLGTSLTEEHAKLIARWTSHVVILYDADGAGERAAARASEILAGEKLQVRVAVMPPGEDPDSVFRKLGAAALQAIVSDAVGPTTFRIELLMRRESPAEESFWQQSAEILAESTNELEVAELIQKLAARHPNLRDPKEAHRAVRKMVLNQRRSSPQGIARRPAAETAAPERKLGLKAAEAVLFRAFLDDAFRLQAWQGLADPDRLMTHRGVEVAEVLRQVFPEAPPAGPPARWLHELQNESVQDLFIELDLRAGIPLSIELVRDTIAQLDRKREEREVQRLKTESTGDDRLRRVNEQLRRLKGN